MFRSVRFVSLLLALPAAACSTATPLPDLGAIYTHAAEAARGAERNPLITIPGTLGSRLVDAGTGTVIWGGGSAGISADPDDPEEYRLIALPISRGDEPLASLTDSVRASGVIETAEAEFLGVPVSVQFYGESLGLLATGGFTVDRRPAGADARDGLTPLWKPVAAAAGAAMTKAEATAQDEFDTFQFDYDWRRDLIETAHAFGRFIERRRAEVAASRGVTPDDVRLDLLTHSMGGLVARYFLMYGFAEPQPGAGLPPVTWEGARFFERVIFVAPPNAGSIVALDNLVNGKDLGPLQPVYPPELLGTHPSAYQLMPRARHDRVRIAGQGPVDIYDPALWQRLGWGLADPDAAGGLALLMPDEPDPERRRARALHHLGRLLDRAETFHAMLDREAPPPPGHLDMYLVVGGGYETPAEGEVDPATGDFIVTGVDEGDGSVLRASALLDERQGGAFTAGLRSPLEFRSTLFLPREHVELTGDPVFGDNLLFWLLEAPRTAAELARPDSAPRLGGAAARAPAPAGATPVFAVPGANQ